MVDRQQPRLPLVHVIAHDGSLAAHLAYQRAHALTERVVLVFPETAPPPDEDAAGAVEAPVSALTVDRILRTARSVGAPYVTVPAPTFSAERILLSCIDATARLATGSWPAVAIQVLRGTRRHRVDNVLAVASQGRTSGSLLLVATVVAALEGARLTKLVVGGVRGRRVRPGPRGDDADLAASLRQGYGVPTDYIHLPERISALELAHEVSAIESDFVVAGLGRLPPGLTYRDLTRDGRRRLLAGPLRVEHTVLRSFASRDAFIVSDAARLRRRSARPEATTGGLDDYFLGDVERLHEVVRHRRQAMNQAAEFGSS